MIFLEIHKHDKNYHAPLVTLTIFNKATNEYKEILDAVYKAFNINNITVKGDGVIDRRKVRKLLRKIETSKITNENEQRMVNRLVTVLKNEKDKLNWSIDK